MNTREWCAVLFLAAFCAGCGGGREPASPLPGSDPVPGRAGSLATASSAGAMVPPSLAPDPGDEGQLAPLPADLFTPQDAQDRAREYDKMVQRMLGDLEDEVRWQENLEALNASLTREASSARPASPSLEGGTR